MRKRAEHRETIYFEMSTLVIVCIIAGFISFFVLNRATTMLLDSYMKRSEYAQRKSLEYAQDIQAFVDENELSSEQVWEISTWTNSHPVVLLQLFDNNQLVFDSMVNVNEAFRLKRRRVSRNIWGYDYQLQMKDVSLRMYVYGSFDYALNNSIMMVEAALSAVLALIIFLLGVRKKIQYIRVLRREVQLLEGGSLNYEITIQGTDELSDLAKGLDTMRISFMHQIEEAEKLADQNKTMVTQISHDLRTPLTAISLYADILETEKSLTEEQREIYLSKILRKIRHMKELSDTLLTYYSGHHAPVAPDIQPFQARQLFYDELSELCGYLNEQGFTLDTQLQWGDCVIMANEEQISRIMNNISSNILKYAEKSSPIHICCGSEEEVFYLGVDNEICKEPQDVSSSGIGLTNIQEMMKQMKGDCLVSREKNRFSLFLSFPSVHTHA